VSWVTANLRGAGRKEARGKMLARRGRLAEQEAAERLALLREQGASAQAFSFRQAFPAPDALAALVVE
jgi:hypothetical protein